MLPWLCVCGPVGGGAVGQSGSLHGDKGERSRWSATASLEDLSSAPKDLPWALTQVSRTPQALSLDVQLRTHPTEVLKSPSDIYNCS